MCKKKHLKLTNLFAIKQVAPYSQKPVPSYFLVDGL